ncbi:MAG TPA: DUF2703 domain-containing protein [Nitrospiria bacterium]
MSRRLEIDFLFWKECPSYPKALERLQKVLNDRGLQAEIRHVEVKSEEDAVKWRFTGSPTIRINGRDIDPKMSGDQPYRLTCRVYYNPEGRPTPVPTEDMFHEYLNHALSKET